MKLLSKYSKLSNLIKSLSESFALKISLFSLKLLRFDKFFEKFIAISGINSRKPLSGSNLFLIF